MFKLIDSKKVLYVKNVLKFSRYLHTKRALTSISSTPSPIFKDHSNTGSKFSSEFSVFDKILSKPNSIVY